MFADVSSTYLFVYLDCVLHLHEYCVEVENLEKDYYSMLQIQKA